MNCLRFDNSVDQNCKAHLFILVLIGAVAGANLEVSSETWNKNAIFKGDTKWKSHASKSNETLDGTAKFAIPYHVSIQAIKNGSYEHICAGTIIEEAFVLTAAHCFHATKDPLKLSVMAGSNKLSEGTRYNVSKIIIHAYYQPLMGRDIALVKVKPKFDFDGKKIDKINLKVTATSGANESAYLIGWGRTQTDPNKSLELVSFRVLNSNLCRKRGFIYVSKTELCAVSYQGRGACDGDSGGALVDSKLSLQLGILSYGKEACKTGRIYAFTYLHPLVDWIKKHIRKNS